jgi:hypothetical protein
MGFELLPPGYSRRRYRDGHGYLNDLGFWNIFSIAFDRSVPESNGRTRD